MLSAQGLSKSFGTDVVLHDINLDIVPGAVTAVCGPSGGGKSTLLRILARLDRPDSGHVLLNGAELAATAAAPGFWPGVTLVFQQQFLWPHLTLAENVMLPLGRRRALNGVQQEYLEQLELIPLMAKKPWQLSVGERARAALARALMLFPKFLLLDEITAALDSYRSETVSRLLREYASSGRGILLVTHDLEFLACTADSCYRLERGSLEPYSVGGHVPPMAVGRSQAILR